MNRVEEFPASIFERFATQIVHGDVGHRRWRNGEDDSGIRADWTYESAKPPVVLEVTALHAPREPQIVSELHKKLEPELKSVVERGSLGEWLVVVDVAANVKRLLPELKALVNEGRSIRVGEYSSQDLMEGDPLAITELHRRLERLGLVELTRKSQGSHGVDWMVTGGGPEIVGFERRLNEALNANRQKLRVDGYESHLAVVVFDFQLSRSPERTDPPALGEGIDFLWVVHTWQGPRGRAEVWVLPAGGSGWLRHSWSEEYEGQVVPTKALGGELGSLKPKK